jgi:hypothetical protein
VIFVENLFAFIKERILKPEHEPEYAGTVENDVVMVMIDGVDGIN